MTIRAPSGFTCCAKYEERYISSGSFLSRLFREFPQDAAAHLILEDKNANAIPLNGQVKFGKIDAWIDIQEEKEAVYVWFRNKEDRDFLVEHIRKVDEDKMKSLHNKLYRWSERHGWTFTEMYEVKKRSNFVGYNGYLDRIAKDVENYKQHQEVLRSIGESKSLNYLLYGEPGTGKTTLTMLLASLYDYPIYVVNSQARRSTMLTPSGPGMKILLFEDFDRYLTGVAESELNTAQSGHMSDILNSLDGVNSGEGIIRIFTGNDCDVIFSNPALVNRMSACFEFKKPTADMFKDKFRALMAVNPNGEEVDEEKLDKLATRVAGKGMTLRPFTNYAIRYLFGENVLDNMLANIEELVKNVYVKPKRPAAKNKYYGSDDEDEEEDDEEEEEYA